MPTLQENVDKVMSDVLKDEQYYIQVSNLCKANRQENGETALTLDQLKVLVEEISKMPIGP